MIIKKQRFCSPVKENKNAAFLDLPQLFYKVGHIFEVTAEQDSLVRNFKVYFLSVSDYKNHKLLDMSGKFDYL